MIERGGGFDISVEVPRVIKGEGLRFLLSGGDQLSMLLEIHYAISSPVKACLRVESVEETDWHRQRDNRVWTMPIRILVKTYRKRVYPLCFHPSLTFTNDYRPLSTDYRSLCLQFESILIQRLSISSPKHGRMPSVEPDRARVDRDFRQSMLSTILSPIISCLFLALS